MTTIAYKNGVFAYDSRVTQGMYVADDQYNKKREAHGCVFFVSGEPAFEDALIDAFTNGKRGDKPGLECGALVWDGKDVWECQFGPNDGFWWHKAKGHVAMGSGHDHAITAMDMGADAKTAVKMAAKRHAGTGGRIRTYRIR